jgi:hypothetical protein
VGNEEAEAEEADEEGTDEDCDEEGGKDEEEGPYDEYAVDKTTADA